MATEARKTLEADGIPPRSIDGIPREIDTVVIGGGQAGLAAGYYLKRHGVPFLILDAQDRVGDAWRNRWDSLRLFTPAAHDGLPGLPFPAARSHYPTKDEMADYLEHYADRFELPVRLGTEVGSLRRTARGRFEVVCGDAAIAARNVIIASGFDHRPRVPEFAGDLDEGIVQLHSKDYRNPSQLREGGVLVVGAGNSGAEIAVEAVGEGHPTWLSGRDPGEEPTRAGTIPDRLLVPLMWFAASRLVKVDNPIGKKVRDKFIHPRRGVPRGRVKKKDIFAAGVEWVERTAGVRDGYPVLEDGRALEVANVVWCTGFEPGIDWIDLPVADEHGVPIHRRGVSEEPGLYFVGLYFQYSLSSPLVGGVGRDAEYVVDHLLSSRAGSREVEV